MQNILLTLGLGTLAVGWVLPGHYPPWVTFQQQWVSAFGALLIASAALAGRPAERVRWPRLAGAVALFAAVPLLQGLASQVHFLSDTVLPALYLIAFAVSMATGSMLARQQGGQWVDAMMTAVVVAAIASTGVAMVQWLQLHHNVFITDLPPGGRPYGNLAQPNHLATLLGMGVAGLLGAYEHERRRVGPLAAALAVAWLGFGLVMTQSRTGWLFVTVLVVWWFLMRRRAALRLRAGALVAGAALFVVGIVTWEPLNDALLLTSGSLEARLHPGPRWLHWTTLWDAIWDKPWLGYGWMQVSLAQQATALAHPASHEMLQDSHNVVLDLMVWMGVPLAVLFVAAVVVWLAVQVRRCRDASRWSLLAASAAILTHSLLEYPLDFTYFLFPLGLMMGSVEGLSDSTAGRAWPRWTLALPLACLAAMLLWIGVECMRLEDSTRQLRFFMRGIGTDRVATVPPPDVKLLDAPREYHQYWLTPARAGMSAEQLDWMRDVMQRNAYPPAMLRYALAAGLNGRPDEAAKMLALICSLNDKQRCAEGRQSWAQLQRRYPQLRAIAMPEPR